MYGATRFWYKRGVVGFRLDAVDTLFEDPNLKDNPILPGKNAYGDPNMKNKYNNKLPESAWVLRGPAQSCRPIQRGADWRNVDRQRRRS